MDFALKGHDGHVGPRFVYLQLREQELGSVFVRKFWRLYLPRLKFHNPAVPMSISRTANQEGPALMTIHFNDEPSTCPITETPLSSTVGQPHISSTERIATINIKHQSETGILTQLMSITKAQPVYPTQEELDKMSELEEQRNLSEKNSQMSKALNEKRRRRDAMLAQARSEVATVREA